MVVYFPSSADNAWRFQTTSSQYGQFYNSIKRETERDKEQESDCDRRVSQLSEELHEAKACLEMVNLGGPMASQWPYGPRGPCCFAASAAGRTCECRQKQPARRNRYNLNSLEAWNCEKQTEPEFLEDHVHCYHPRLARPSLFPKITFDQMNKAGRSLSGGYSSGGGRPPARFGGGEEPRSIRSSPAHARRNFTSSAGGGPNQNAKTNVLPASSRYGFYKYYGFAGQGAKTTKGYHPQK